MKLLIIIISCSVEVHGFVGVHDEMGFVGREK